MHRSSTPLNARLTARTPRHRARALFTLAVLALFATACGAAGAAETTLVTPVVIEPTPVPTTAPIILPPEELDLPAVAALPDALTAPVVDPAADPTVDPAALADDSMRSSGTAGSAEASPGADASPSVTTPATDTSTPSVTGPAAVATADRWDPCVVDAALALSAASVLDAVVLSPETDVRSQQLNSLASAASSCGTVSSNLGVTDLAAHLDTSSSCLDQWLASDAGGSVFVGLTSIGWGLPVPAWAADAFQTSMLSCFSGDSFAALVMADVAAEPRLAGAFDGSCLATSFDQSGTLATYAAMLASAPTQAALSIGLDDPWVLGCANVGQLVAAAAANEGVELSGSTIACIDAELRTAGLVGDLIAGTADSEAVGVATITCLTDGEAAALLG